MQQSVVPQVGVVQTVLRSIGVVPEGQEKLTLPQVTLTVCEDASTPTKTSADALSPPGGSDGQGRTPKSGAPPDIKEVRNKEKRIRKNKKSSLDRIQYRYSCEVKPKTQ